MRALTWAGIVAMALVGAARVQAQAVTVGTTKDACDGDERVTFQAKGGQVSVKAPDDQTKDLSSAVREIRWKCGGSDERSANDEPFNRVRIKRASNGAITWTFSFVSSGTGTSSVGNTKDACDKDDAVTLAGKSGKETVLAGQHKTIDLASASRELDWYCGGTRERVANDHPFNRVHLVRAGNGALTWTFQLVPPGAMRGGPELTRVGESHDACDRGETVTMQDGAVSVKPSDIQQVFFDPPTRSFKFFCGDSKERATNPNLFNVVQVERAGNGALHWVFYRQNQVVGDNVGDFVHNVAGDVIGGLHAASGDTFTPVQRGFLKSALDAMWTAESDGLSDEFGDIAGDEDDVKVDNVTLSPATLGELRMARTRDGVTLKYVVHENQVAVSWLRPDPEADINVVLTFDIELVMVFPRNQPVTGLKVDRAHAFARHVSITGGDNHGNFVVELARTTVHRKETSLGTKSRDITDRVNARLKDLRDQLLQQLGVTAIPPGFDNLMVNAGKDGTLEVCVNKHEGLNAQQQRAQSCKFPATGEADARRALGDTSGSSEHDSCGQSLVWVWDHEKGRFVSVAKGTTSAVIELDNRRLEWFCGGAAEPDTDNDEWATGPDRTYGVRVKRAGSGGGIDWEFVDWRAE